MSLIIKGLHLIWSGNVHVKLLELPPFAAPAGLPKTCDRLSRPRTTTGAPPACRSSGATPWHFSMPSLVHTLDLTRAGEAAGRNLWPRFPRVGAGSGHWLRSSSGPRQTPYVYLCRSQWYGATYPAHRPALHLL